VKSQTKDERACSIAMQCKQRGKNSKPPTTVWERRRGPNWYGSARSRGHMIHDKTDPLHYRGLLILGRVKLQTAEPAFALSHRASTRSNSNHFVPPCLSKQKLSKNRNTPLGGFSVYEQPALMRTMHGGPTRSIASPVATAVLVQLIGPLDLSSRRQVLRPVCSRVIALSPHAWVNTAGSDV